MKTKVSPAIVGLFVIGAFALGIIALLTFGGVNFFAKPQRFVVYFNESIHGLDIGSALKLRGVRVGRVVGINIRYDNATNRSVIAVVCELSRNMVTDLKGEEIDVADRAELQTLVDRGLRAQLGVIGLATGQLFVELDFFDPKEFPRESGPGPDDQKYVAVPAVPSTISTFQASASEILANLKKVDFAGLSRELTNLIADVRKRLEGVDLRGVAEQWKKTGAEVEALAKSPELKRSFASLELTLSDLRSALGRLDAQVAANGAQLQAALAQAKDTLATFNAAADGAHKFIAAQGGLGQEATRALAQLADAAEAVQRLTEFLERNPQALILGKKPPP